MTSRLKTGISKNFLRCTVVLFGSNPPSQVFLPCCQYICTISWAICRLGGQPEWTDRPASWGQPRHHTQCILQVRRHLWKQSNNLETLFKNKSQKCNFWLFEDLLKVCNHFWYRGKKNSGKYFNCNNICCVVSVVSLLMYVFTYGMYALQSRFELCISYISERFLHIFPGSVHLFCCNQIGRPIEGIAHWYMNVELGLRPCSFFSGNIFPLIFCNLSLHCLCMYEPMHVCKKLKIYADMPSWRCRHPCYYTVPLCLTYKMQT